MDKGRKKLRICLAGIVFLAVVIGLIYYFWYGGQSGITVNEGTLIVSDWRRFWL